MPLTEAQFNFAEHPRQGNVTAEFDAERVELLDFEDKVTVLRVLSEAERKGIEFGGDIAAHVPENIEEEIDFLRGKILSEADDTVVLEGDTAEHVFDIFHVVAETDEFESGIRNEARRMLGMPLLEDGYVSAYKTSSWGREVIEREIAEAVKQIREENNHELAQKARNEEHSPTKPEPLWADQHGKVLAQGEYMRLTNPEEMLVAYRAVKLLGERRHGKDEPTSLEQHIDKGDFVADLKGQEAHFTRAALHMVASGFLRQPDSQLARAHATDQEAARRMLDIRAQGLKEIERVEITPEDHVRYAQQPASGVRSTEADTHGREQLQAA